MIFTTVKKRVEKEELFPNDAVMTLVDNKFSLNKKAMELFGFPLNTANTSKIANGFDESNNIILATMDTNDMYTNNVTAKNDFSSQLLATRIDKYFKLDEVGFRDNYFKLNLIEEGIGVKFVGLDLIHSIDVKEVRYNDEEPSDFHPFIEPLEEELIAIETAHADEIAQIDEVIEESQLSCAELLPAPPEEIILIDTQEEFVAIEQVIPAEIVKKVINTDNW